jgi:hypothetical protein
MIGMGREKKKHIALFLPSLRGGGAEKVMVNLALGFVEQGLKVDLVLAKAEGPYLSRVPEEVRVVDLGARARSLQPSRTCALPSPGTTAGDAFRPKLC